MEDKLTIVANRVSPKEKFTSNVSTISQATPTITNRKIRQRKKLLKRLRDKQLQADLESEFCI
jgi:hypothetical protein